MEILILCLQFVYSFKSYLVHNNSYIAWYITKVLVCVLLGKLNELSKSEKEPIPPPAVPSAYSEVFDRCVLNLGSAYAVYLISW